MSQVIEFFENRVPNNAGYMIDDILTQKDYWLEASHDWVQWMFPLKDLSNFNEDAPILTDEDIEFFKSPKAASVAANYIAGINRMLIFMGLDSNTSSGNVEIEVVSEERAMQVWAGQFNHNHLRITRMLKSMMLLGFNDYAVALYDAMSTYDIPLSARQHWVEAVNAD